MTWVVFCDYVKVLTTLHLKPLRMSGGSLELDLLGEEQWLLRLDSLIVSGSVISGSRLSIWFNFYRRCSRCQRGRSREFV